MAKGKGFFESRAFKNTMPKIYGIGAAVVIIGALFKILHWEGANTMLMVGLFTEAGIFFISAFEPVHDPYDWTLVYPELAGIDPASGKKREEKISLTDKLNKMLEDAKIEQTTVNKLGEGLKSLSENVNQMGTFSNAAVATNEYATKVKEASASVNTLNASYTKAIVAIDEMGKTGDASTQYNEKVKSVTGKLAELNTVYEMELNDSKDHLGKLKTYYGSLSKAIENLQDSEEATRTLKTEFASLNQNLNTLNTVYGNMLSAMSGVAAR